MVRPLAARAKGPGFDSPIAQDVQRLISRAYMLVHWYLVVLGPITWVHFFPLDSIVQ